MNQSLLAIEDYDRLFIRVGDYSNLRKVAMPAGNSKKWQGWARGLGIAADVGLELLPLGRVAKTVAKVAVTATSRTLPSNSEKEATTERFYWEVPNRIAKRELDWASPEHWRKDGLLVLSPRNGRRYLPYLNYHALSFEDKFNEAIRVLEALRPKELTVIYEEGYESEINAAAALKLRGVKGGAGAAKGSYERMDNKKVLHYGEYERPGLLERFRRPELPEELSWYPTEGQWQSIVNGVLHNRKKKVILEVVCEEDYGLDAEFDAAVKLAGFKLSGNYTRFQSTKWVIEATFW